MEKLLERLNRLSFELIQIEKIVKEISYISTTKSHKIELAKEIQPKIKRISMELDKYRNLMEPFVVGDKENSINAELFQILEDIRGAAYANANGNQKEVDRILMDVVNRI